jgi:preprotein translocase subunit SecA
MIGNAFKKVFGTKHDRTIKSLKPIVARINALEEELQHLSDEELRAKTGEFKERLNNGETTDDLLEEAYAVVKNACRRMVGKEVPRPPGMVKWVEVPYDVQIMGGIMLHRGGISEMQTGEGKTLVGVMPLYLNALTGRNCQLVTVNDFLAMRDSEWVGSVLRWLGLTVGCIQNSMSPAERREQYGCDVTYGTNSEFGFDYLRDMGMANHPSALVQRDHFFVIIDEVDSILIDEARTPLIISGPAARSTHRYDKLKPAVASLYRKQNQLITTLINEARSVLTSDEATEAEEDEAYEKVLKVKMGMPKHRQLMRLMEDPAVQRELDKLEMMVRSDQNRGVYQEFKESLYFTIDEKHHDTELSEKGRTALRPREPESFVLPDLSTGFKAIDDDTALDDEQRHAKKEELQNLFDERSETIHNISQLLRAYCLYERDHHYIVVDNKVVIVDEFTGRSMPGRRFGEGLHQALEAKEDVTIERETQTLATVTIQNYFRMYDKLAGMTGTAETEAGEFRDIYKLEVAVIPTNRPCIRVDEDDRIFRTRKEKYRAIIEDIKARHATGQPVLLGTVSVQVSETLSRMLQREKIAHNVLNAKNHAREAEIVEQAGQLNAITIATNMAGRGTDIRLGPGVPELGGLCVIGSGRHDSRRVDRQLRGRCSRQGDPGVSRFYISLEDDLMRLFGSDRIAGWMQKMGMKDGEELSHPWLNRSIESAQRKVEQQHFSVRKRVLQYDDVVNKQRNVVYGRRRDILLSNEPRKLLFDYVYNTIYDRIGANQQDPRTHGSELDTDSLLGWLQTTFPIGLDESALEYDGVLDVGALADTLTDKVDEAYQRKEHGEDMDAMRSLERTMMLNPHDQHWQVHIDDMDQLRQGVHLWSHAQKDPLVVYKREAFVMFENLVDRINEEICSNMFRSVTSLEGFRRMLASLPMQEVHAILGQFSQEEMAMVTGQPQTQTMAAPGEPAMRQRQEPEKVATYRRSMEKVGRNDPCPCGSGRKYKKCCAR